MVSVCQMHMLTICVGKKNSNVQILSTVVKKKRCPYVFLLMASHLGFSFHNAWMGVFLFNLVVALHWLVYCYLPVCC